MVRVRDFIFVVIASALLSGCITTGDIKSAPGTTTTLIMLRHAERPMMGKELTEKGRIRAAALPVALKDTPIDAIYSPDLSRNLDTVAPLAKQRGMTVKVLEIGWTDGVAIRLIRANPGKTILWVGNYDNLQEIYEDIGAEGTPPLDYGDLFFVRIPDKGPVEVTKSRYGQ
jgi:hypothetical protein